MALAPAFALLVLVLVPLGAAQLACGKRARPEAHRAVRIGELGVSVDAPPGWELVAAGKASYRAGDAEAATVVCRSLRR